MAIDKRFEIMDDDLENIAGGRTYGYGTNFYMTVQTNQSYLPLMSSPNSIQGTRSSWSCPMILHICMCSI